MNQAATVFEKSEHQLELEQMFRSFYEKSGDPVYQLPHSYPYYEPVILKATRRYPDSLTLRNCASLLSEDAFFAEGVDTVIHPHLSWFPPIWHIDHFFVVQLVLRGSMTTYIGDRALQLRAGNVCIIAPGTRHAISCFSDACTVKILIRSSTFERAFFGILRDTEGPLTDFFMRTLYSTSPHPYLYFDGAPDGELTQLLERLLREAASHRAYHAQMLNAYMQQFFITLLRNHEQDLSLPEFAGTAHMDELLFLLRYIQEHAASVTLSELSRLFNYSERQIQRVLKKSTGKSFTEITQSIRMEEAARLLRRTRDPVSKIAQELGYANLGNFRKLFRKRYGMSPAEYRRVPEAARAASAEAAPG